MKKNKNLVLPPLTELLGHPVQFLFALIKNILLTNNYRYKKKEFLDPFLQAK